MQADRSGDQHRKPTDRQRRVRRLELGDTIRHIPRRTGRGRELVEEHDVVLCQIGARPRPLVPGGEARPLQHLRRVRRDGVLDCLLEVRRPGIADLVRLQREPARHVGEQQGGKRRVTLGDRRRRRQRARRATNRGRGRRRRVSRRRASRGARGTDDQRRQKERRDTQLAVRHCFPAPNSCDGGQV